MRSSGFSALYRDAISAPRDEAALRQAKEKPESLATSAPNLSSAPLAGRPTADVTTLRVQRSIRYARSVGFLIDTCAWIDVEQGALAPADVGTLPPHRREVLAGDPQGSPFECLSESTRLDRSFADGHERTFWKGKWLKQCCSTGQDTILQDFVLTVLTTPSEIRSAVG
jgi:hypothetical protein